MDKSAVARPVVLLEREQEVERIRAALRAGGQGEGRALMIEAAPGIGKSRLLDETRASALGFGMRLFHARATELERGFPFGVVRQLFERVLLEASPDERDRWLAGAAALAADLLTGAPAAGAAPEADGAPTYAWQHGLYWLAANLAADSPVALVVDDLQWCDAPSASTLSFIARRLEGQPLALVLATRPLDPALAPEAAMLVSDPATEILRPAPLTPTAVGTLVSTRLGAEPDQAFVHACIEVTGGNPFLVGELLDEVAARGMAPSLSMAGEVASVVPRGVVNGVLLRLARLPAAAGALARALSVLDDSAQVGDAALLARLDKEELESALGTLVSAGIVEPGGTVRFVHPMLRAAIYGDQSPAERQRLHHAAATILRERDAPSLQVAAQVMQTEPEADLSAVALLHEAAYEAWRLGDATGAAALLSRALEEPPAREDRLPLLLDLGQAYARTGSAEAIAPLTEVVECGEPRVAGVKAAIELSGMLFYAGRAPEGAAILRRARERLAPGDPARERLDVAVLGVSYTSLSARREAKEAIATLRVPDGPARDLREATILATLAMDEVMYLRSAASAVDLAQRALAADLPVEAQRGGNWAVLALAVLAVGDELGTALRKADEFIARARRQGAALTVVSLSALRAGFAFRRGDLAATQADAQAAFDLTPELMGTEFLVLGVAAAVLAGLERDESPASLRRLIDRTGVKYEGEFLPNSQLRYAVGALSAAAGNHELAVEQLRGCDFDDPAFGGDNPAMLPWRSAAALSLAELGRSEEAGQLAADELRRAQSFGARRAIGIALRAQALVGPAEERGERLAHARAVLEESPAQLEHARVLVDLGATFRAAGRRKAAKEPLLEGLELASTCGARTLERRARAELGAIGIRPRASSRTGADSLTPSERRVVDLAATGGTNREIAQALFVTEKTVETHLGHAFRKLEISSRRQLPDALAGAGGVYVSSPSP